MEYLNFWAGLLPVAVGCAALVYATYKGAGNEAEKLMEDACSEAGKGEFGSIFNRSDEYTHCNYNPANITLDRLESYSCKKVSSAYNKALIMGKAQDKPKLIAENGDWYCVCIHGVVVGSTPVEAYEVYLKMRCNSGTK